MVSNFFAFDTASTGGARVAAIDLDQDGRTELLVGSGPGHLPRARFFDPRTATLLDEFASDWTAAASGVFVG